MIALKAVTRGHASIGHICLLAALAAGCGGDEAGSIVVSVATHGGNTDPDGYVITLGARTIDAPVNGDVAITDLAAGSYTLTLSGVAPDCAVSGTNPVFVMLQDGEQGHAGFIVSCPVPASVAFSVVTTGPADTDGYLVRVGPEVPQRILANGLTTVQSRAPGLRGFVLSDVATDCTPSGENPTTVDVRLDKVTEVDLLVRCGANGALHATVIGDNLGPDERYLYIDGQYYAFDSTGDVTIPVLRSGPYAIHVFGCEIVPDNPQMVTIAPEITTDVTLTVSSCNLGPL